MREIWQSLSNSPALSQQACLAQLWLTSDPSLGGRAPRGSTRTRSEGSDGIGFHRMHNSSPVLAQSQGEPWGGPGRTRVGQGGGKERQGAPRAHDGDQAGDQAGATSNSFVAKHKEMLTIAPPPVHIKHNFGSKTNENTIVTPPHQACFYSSKNNENLR